MSKFYFSNALKKKHKSVRVTVNTNRSDTEPDREDDADIVSEGTVVIDATTEVVTNTVVKEVVDTNVEKVTDIKPDESPKTDAVKTTKRTRKSSKTDKTEEISPANDEKAGDE